MWNARIPAYVLAIALIGAGSFIAGRLTGPLVPAAGIVTVVASTLVLARARWRRRVASGDWLEQYGSFLVVIPAAVGLAAVIWVHVLGMLAGPSAFGALATCAAFIWSFGIAFVSMVAFLLFETRKSGKPTVGLPCEHCGYRVDNIKGPRCPECGAIVKRGESDEESDLF